MEQIQKSERKAKKRSRFYNFFLKPIIHYSYAVFSALIIILGFLNLYDIVFSDKYTDIQILVSHNDYIKANVRTSPELTFNFNEVKAWEALQPSLCLLDKVCPEISNWTRLKYKQKKLTWITNQNLAINGSYCIHNDSLMLSSGIFDLKDGEKACTLAHEFRHSRQNFSKYCKSSIAFLITGIRDERIIEDDAYFYEFKVREAIFGIKH